MTTKRAVLALFVLAAAFGVSAAPFTTNPGTNPKPRFKEGEIIVKFKRPAADTLERQLADSIQSGNLQLSGSLDQLSGKHGVTAIRPLFSGFKANRERVENLRRKDARLLAQEETRLLRRLARAPGNVAIPELDRIYTIKLAPGRSAEQAVADYRQDPAVEYAELNHIVSICLTPNDPAYPVQWALNNTGQMYPASGEYRSPPGVADKDMDAPESWDFYADSSPVIVAVIDTGVDYTHRDLQGNLWTNGAGQYGYDFVNDDSDPMDDNRHGTHCAGIIAARNNNGLDIAGVSWNAKIMAVKFLDEFGDGDDSDGVQAIVYATDNGADILSNSWVSEDESGLIQDAVAYAVSQGVVFVAAAGNGNSSAPNAFPAVYDGVIAVAATDSADDRAPFSNYGSWVDIAAPGVDILSLRAAGTGAAYPYPPGDTNAPMHVLSGTSMACPYVAGACAVVLSIDPSLSSEAVRTTLMTNSDALSDSTICASGRLNVDKAARHAVSRKGSLFLDKTHYHCDDSIGLRVNDRDLAGSGSCTVTVTTDGNDSETVALVEQGLNVGVFKGSIQAVAGTPSTGDGTVQVTNKSQITAMYLDANDGTGNPAWVTNTAKSICTGNPIPDDHWWMLDEASGTVAEDFIDGSGLADGSFNGASPGWVLGVSGGAIDLNGVSEYFAVPALDNAYENTDTFTVAGWFNTAQSTGLQTIVGMWMNAFPTPSVTFYFGWQVLVENNKVVARFGQSGSTTLDIVGTSTVTDGQWHHFALTYPTEDANAVLYVDGEPEGTPGPKVFYTHPNFAAKFRIGDGSNRYGTNGSSLKGGPFNGMIDDVMLYKQVLSAEEVALLSGQGVPSGKASNPNPAHLAVNVGINADLGWTAAGGATSHDVYFGAANPPPFRINQTGTTYDPGLLQQETTYYWRIDEHSPGGTTTGDVWSFNTLPFLPGQASNPSPGNGATNVSVAATLSWTAGSDATARDVYFGTANPPPLVSADQTGTTYNPGTLNGSTTYYWRVDEQNAAGTTQGTVWSFTTAGAPPVFVGAGSVASSTGAITPGLPSGLAAGDILLLLVETANQAVSVSNPNGGTWAAIAGSPQSTGSANGSTGVRLTAFWSRYNGTQGAPTTSDSGNHQLGRIVAIRGAVASGNPWNVTAGGVEAVADTSGSIAGTTTTVANTLVVTAIATALPDGNGTSNFSGWANANLTGLTERTDNTTSQGNGGGLGIATATKAAAGAYGNTTVTCASSSYKAMLSVAVRP